MKNYLKYNALIAEKELKGKMFLEQLNKEYDIKLKEFDFKFSKEIIEGLGFKEVGFYGAGNEYVYEKNGKKICVYRDFGYVCLRSMSAIGRIEIYDSEELEDYANGIIYKDFKFYCYY